MINVNSKLLVIPFMLIILTIIFAINIGNTYAASPDLVVNGTSAPTNVTNGQNLTVNYTVKNIGTGNTTSGYEWQDNIYLSKNNTFDGSAIRLASSKHSNLSAGASYNDTFNIDISTIDCGKYYLIMSTDDYNDIDESNEDNNLLVSQLQINVSGPDLIVTNANGPTTGTNGQNLTVNYTVKNAGTGNTPSGTGWYDSIYLSTDDIWDDSDTPLGDSSDHSNLSAGASYNDKFNLTIPVYISSGNYYLLIVADCSRDIAESNGDNNYLAIPLQINVLGPDLVVNSTNAPVNATNGQDLTVNYTVKNVGTRNTPSGYGWYDSIYLSTDSTWDDSDTPLGGSSNYYDLRGGASYNGTFSITIPRDVSSGKYYLIISTNCYGSIAESNITNNMLVVPLQIKVLTLDLTVNSTNASVNATKGENLLINYTVKNSGTGNTLSEDEWYDGIYLSSDDIWDDSDTPLGDSSSWHYDLSAGASYNDTFDITLPDDINIGNYYLLIIADSGNNLPESNETNNVLAIPLQINMIPLDLTVNSTTTSINATNGQDITVNYTVKNSGTEFTPSGYGWLDSIYLSTDDIWDSSDRQLGDSSPWHYDLSAGGDYPGSFDITLPDDINIGDYYLLIKIDLWNNIVESNETNNVLAIPLQINMIPLDLTVNSTTTSINGNNGDYITVNYTVKNTGTEVTPSGYDWCDSIYLSMDDILDNYDRWLGDSSDHSNLSAGGDYLDSFNICLDADGGNYYLLIVTDSWNNIAESNESNNVLAIPLQISASGPDLIVNNINAPTNATNGQNITVNYTVKNTGAEDTPSGYGWMDRIYLSTDDSLDSSYVWLLSDSNHSNLIAGDNYPDSFNITIPDYINSGNYYLLIVTDSWNDIVESNGNNNVLAIPLQISASGPDLIVNITNAPTNATNGQNITVNYTVKNTGTEDISSGTGWYDSIYLSTDDIWDDSDTPLGDSSDQSNLSAGGNYPDSFDITIPDDINSGNYYLLIITDSEDNIAESNESNNVLAIPLQLIILPPDLVVNSINAPANATNGQNITVNFTVKNTGTGNISSEYGWCDYIYLSTDDKLDGSDTPLDGLYHSGLSAGATYSGSLNITIPRDKTGNYYLIISTDDYDNIAESDETNNLLAIPLRINSLISDLVVNNTNVPTNATNGQNITVNYTVENTGTSDIPSGYDWYDSIYLSTDDVLDMYDILLANSDHSGLNAGSTYSNKVNITIPGYISGGNYYLILTIDSWDDLPEFNETNNMLAIPLQINVSGPDLIVNSTNAPDNAINGQNLSINYTVSNIGALNTLAGSGWYDRIYLSKDTQLDSSDYYLGELGHSGLNASNSYTNTFNIAIPGHITDGNYYLLITTAVWNWITESNGSNNILASPLHIQAAPTVADVDPANNSKINSTSKVITVTFNEPVQAGSAYDTITVTGPSGAINVAKNINGKVLTLTPTSNYVNGDYTVNIPINAVTDLEGTGLATPFALNFSVDVTKPTVSANSTGGLFKTSQSVLLTASDNLDHPVIYYTTDGINWYQFIGSGTVLISKEGTTNLEFYAKDATGNPSEHTTYSYTIDKTAPAVTANKTSGLSNSNIYVTLSSEPNATIYYSINSGSWNSFIGSGTVSIGNVGTNNLEFYAVDAARNPSAHTTYSYIIDKTAPKVTSTYPKKYATGVSRTKTIYIKFSEKIKSSSYWSKIVVKDKYGHAVKISKSISGNILYIKTSKRSSYSYYTVYIPKAAVKDYAGNNLAAGYTFKFKTGRY